VDNQIRLARLNPFRHTLYAVLSDCYRWMIFKYVPIEGKFYISSLFRGIKKGLQILDWLFEMSDNDLGCGLPIFNNKYKIKEYLGEGRFSYVFKASNSDKYFIVKVPKPDKNLDNEEGFLKKLKVEKIKNVPKFVERVDDNLIMTPVGISSIGNFDIKSLGILIGVLERVHFLTSFIMILNP